MSTIKQEMLLKSKSEIVDEYIDLLKKYRALIDKNTDEMLAKNDEIVEKERRRNWWNSLTLQQQQEYKASREANNNTYKASYKAPTSVYVKQNNILSREELGL